MNKHAGGEVSKVLYCPNMLGYKLGDLERLLFIRNINKKTRTFFPLQLAMTTGQGGYTTNLSATCHLYTAVDLLNSDPKRSSTILVTINIT